MNKETTQKEWLVIDAKGLVLGRMATQIAMWLRGKHKPGYTPHYDCGDYVIVLNADKIKLTGSKMDDKLYITHSGYPGGQKTATPKQLLARTPEKVVERAVKGMLPKNKLGSQLYRNLFVYTGAEHPHQAQQPKEVNL